MFWRLKLDDRQTQAAKTFSSNHTRKNNKSFCFFDAALLGNWRQYRNVWFKLIASMTVEDVKELAHIERVYNRAHRKEDVKLKCNFEIQRKSGEKKVGRPRTGCIKPRRTLRTMSKWQQHKINLPNSIKQLKLPKKEFASWLESASVPDRSTFATA